MSLWLGETGRPPPVYKHLELPGKVPAENKLSYLILRVLYLIASHRIVSYCIVSYLTCILSFRIVTLSYRVVSYLILSSVCYLRLTVIYFCHPAAHLSSSTILHHVVFILPDLLFLSNAVFFLIIHMSNAIPSSASDVITCSVHSCKLLDLSVRDGLGPLYS